MENGSLARPKPRAERDMRFVLHPADDTAYAHYEGSDANPFEPAAAGISRMNAWWLAEAALLAYWPPAIAIARFRAAGMESAFIEQRGVQCYVSVAPAFAIGGEGESGGRLDLALERNPRRAAFRLAHAAAVDRRPAPVGDENLACSERRTRQHECREAAG